MNKITHQNNSTPWKTQAEIEVITNLIEFFYEYNLHYYYNIDAFV